LRVGNLERIGQMAANPQPTITPREQAPLKRSMKHLEKKKSGLELSRESLIIAWATMAGVVVAAFLIGFYSGRENGIKLALERANLESERIPVISEVSQANGLFAEDVAPESETALLEAAPVELGDSTAGFSERTAGQGLSASLKDAKSPPRRAIKSEIATKPTTLTDSAAKTTGVKLQELKKGFYVQVAAPTSQDEASELVEKLTARKHSAGVQQAKLEGGTFHRVLVGPFNSAKLARQAQVMLERSKLIRDTPFVRRIY